MLRRAHPNIRVTAGTDNIDEIYEQKLGLSRVAQRPNVP